METKLRGITSNTFRMLAAGSAILTEVPAFLSGEECQTLASQIRESRAFETPGNGFLGGPIFQMPQGSPEYFAHASAVAGMFTGLLSRLQDHFGKAISAPGYPDGEYMRGLTSFIYEPGYDCPPRQAETVSPLPWIGKGATVVLFLPLASAGGTLQVWNLQIWDDPCRFYLPGTCTIDKSKLAGVPTETVEIEAGTLYLWNPRRLHAVRLADTTTVTVQGTLAQTGTNEYYLHS